MTVELIRRYNTLWKSLFYYIKLDHYDDPSAYYVAFPFFYIRFGKQSRKEYNKKLYELSMKPWKN